MRLKNNNDNNNQITVGKNICKNITIVNGKNEVVAIIMPNELVELKGYRIKFDVGEKK